MGYSRKQVPLKWGGVYLLKSTFTIVYIKNNLYLCTIIGIMNNINKLEEGKYRFAGNYNSYELEGIKICVYPGLVLSSNSIEVKLLKKYGYIK
jgi:hypothetical protein